MFSNTPCTDRTASVFETGTLGKFDFSWTNDSAGKRQSQLRARILPDAEAQNKPNNTGGPQQPKIRTNNVGTTIEQKIHTQFCKY
ncbi:hypothetical protein T06_16623 [Trichinella sp. T6]|nr:hypothetical protein T06_16623 [Trichinella sp. T6]